MNKFNDLLESLLDAGELCENEIPQVIASVQLKDKTGFIENRKCARCVGECKVY